MKGAVTASCIFLAIIVGLILSMTALESACKEISTIADSVCKSIDGGDWDEARKTTKELKKTWEESSIWIAMLVDHEEIDRIMTSIAALGEYVRYEETPELLAELKTLIILIEHIPVKEKPTLSNIL